MLLSYIRFINIVKLMIRSFFVKNLDSKCVETAKCPYLCLKNLGLTIKRKSDNGDGGGCLNVLFDILVVSG